MEDINPISLDLPGHDKSPHIHHAKISLVWEWNFDVDL